MTIDTRFSRQYDIVKPEDLQTPIRIIGAGGIGSWTTLALAKLGCASITVQDFDTVGEENTASQIYSMGQLDKSKVEALSETINNLVNFGIMVDEKPWEKGQEISERIVIMALDNIDTRRDLWQDLKSNDNVDLVIDGRMAGDFLRVYFIPLNGDTSAYESTLVPRDDIEPEPCTSKAVVYNVFMVASIISNLVKQFARGQKTEFDEFSFDLFNLLKI